jgi:O-antigen/teichoic acid export membrane protein
MSESRPSVPSFYSGFLKLFSGMAVVQLLNFVFSLILPKYYSPADYALFGIFTAVIFILIEVISLKLEMTVFLPETDREAIEIVHVIFFISGLISIPLLAVAAVCCYIYGPVFILLPALLLIFGFIQGLNPWFTRVKDYKTLNTYRILQAIFTPGFSLVFIIFLNWKFGLVIGFILGQLIGLFYLVFAFDHIHISLMNFSLARKYLRKYQQFPKFGVASSLINSFSRNSLVFFIERFFGVANAGYYTLTSRLLNTPAGMYQSSLTQVYMVQASALKGAALNSYTQAMVRFGFLVGILPVLAIVLFGQPVFSFLFGQQWIEAGKMSQYIVFWIFTSTIINPVGFLLDIKQKLKFEFGWNIALLLLRIGAILAGFFTSNLYLMLSLFSGISILLNIYLYWYVLKLTNEPAD